jgi:Holliday junction resolvase RusA-like endonuclease
LTRLFVPGIPIPQGSKVPGVTKLGIPYVRDVRAGALKAWRHKIACEADIGQTYDCPVELDLWFYLPRPKRPKFNVPAVKPDFDKLTRAVCDALTDGGLLADDSRIVEAHQHKRYASAWHPAGVMIDVKEWNG